MGGRDPNYTNKNPVSRVGASLAISKRELLSWEVA